MKRKGEGVWLPAAFVKGLLKLRLRPASLHSVYLCIATTSFRYGGNDARLSNTEIATATGLSCRTVAVALKKLIEAGLVSRPSRYRCFALGRAKKISKKISAQKIRDEAKASRRRRTDRVTSPMSIYVLNTLGTNNAFSQKQLEALASWFEEAYDCGVDMGTLPASHGVATYRAAYDEISSGNDTLSAHRYVKMVKTYVQSDAVQGFDLELG